MTSATCRRTDPMTGVVAEVGTDGVPVGLALPEEILDRAPSEVARAVLRALTAAAADARELLERLAEQDWDEADRAGAEVDDDHGDEDGHDHDHDHDEDGHEWHGGQR